MDSIAERLIIRQRETRWTIIQHEPQLQSTSLCITHTHTCTLQSWNTHFNTTWCLTLLPQYLQYIIIHCKATNCTVSAVRSVSRTGLTLSLNQIHRTTRTIFKQTSAQLLSGACLCTTSLVISNYLFLFILTVHRTAPANQSQTAWSATCAVSPSHRTCCGATSAAVC